MKSRTFLIIAALAMLFTASCQSPNDLTEEEVYTIINEVISDDSLFIYSVCWEFQELEMTPEMKKEFTSKDIAFIHTQNERFKNLKVKPNKLKWYKRRQKIFDFTKVDTVCDQGIIYHLSFPLISVDRQKLIIEFQEDCNCFLGGQGGKDLYEKKNGHWVKTKGFDHWVSDRPKPNDNKQIATDLVVN
jgi:hypothetical protein